VRTRAEIVSALTNPGVLAIVRMQKPAPLMEIVEALLAGGVTAAEISLSTPNALEAFRVARAKLGERACLGVGTVIDATTCRAALEAGAEFIVTPICRPELVALAHAADRAILLGAFTPTEAQTAHEAGADFIKIFPADDLGPGYMKALRAPLPHLRLVPTGGVGLQNLAEYFKAGCPAVGVASSLVPAKALQDGDWPEVTRRASEFAAAARNAKAEQLT
jgi:2-dehydro-3-deoxyphosphogluconate aldolase / (4S)-4-hydroxy-2-oxoglutarate aldolase